MTVAVKRVLFVVRPDAHTRPGGDLVHAEQTAQALRGLGVAVDVVPSLSPDARGYDLAHVFGVFEPDTVDRQLTALEAGGIPIVLSPIWLDLAPFFHTAPRIERALRARSPAAIGRALAKIAGDHRVPRWSRATDRRRRAQRAAMLRAAVLLPASNVEAYLYASELGLSHVPFVVVPLGVDEAPFAAPRPVVRAGVICCARIEPKKNQAALLYALRDIDVDVTLIGDAYDERYANLCRTFATPRTRFVGHASRAEVFVRMAGAAVHAHPSWLESPGLSSLEAAAAGARLVVGDRGTEREYFGSDVAYADPADVGGIRTAVLRALDAAPRERGDALELRLRARTWQRTAEATLEAYARALAGRR